jgi:cytochrome b involved in lipid metabolism
MCSTHTFISDGKAYVSRAFVKHNKPGDAWSAFNGKVYNLTEYARFHPGGEKELMRCAGRDGTKLFSKCPPCL